MLPVMLFAEKRANEMSLAELKACAIGVDHSVA
jgi:hypothetical protein